ncbi:MAG: hypothetical protein B6I22_06250 [Desulfobacteraceae bacterium 4572_123]|nr:MAG: hypothetical protein B6I22_06250 [Desulfobacteraceae bacterium 4572_123]
MGNKVIKKLPVFLILLSFLVLTYGGDAVSAKILNSHRQVIELNVDNRPYPKAIPYENIWLDRNGHFDGSFFILYSVEVLPGENYTLGFFCPAVNRNVVVTLFDRWPYSHGVKRIKLPMGPYVRTNRKTLKYRWSLGISSKSSSSLLYIAVALRPGNIVKSSSMAHRIFFTTFKTKPMSTMGQGITYLQGPNEFILTGEQGSVSYVVKKPASSFDLSKIPTRSIRGDLIKNAWFKDGLNYWKPHKNYSISQDIDFFSLQADGLKITSLSESNKEGILQIIEKDVTDADTLTLRVDVKVGKQTLGGTGPDGKDAPIAVAVSYTGHNDQGDSYSNIFWKGFFSLNPVEPMKSANGQKVPEGLWYRYIFNLMQLNPKPGFIKFISLESSGWPEREGWVKDIHLIKRGKK